MLRHTLVNHWLGAKFNKHIETGTFTLLLAAGWSHKARKTKPTTKHYIVHLYKHEVHEQHAPFGLIWQWNGINMQIRCSVPKVCATSCGGDKIFAPFSQTEHVAQDTPRIGWPRCLGLWAKRSASDVYVWHFWRVALLNKHFAHHIY